MMTARRPVIVDCDPGIDDAVALLLAAAAPELDLRAVTAAAGNVGLVHTERNARRVLTLAGREVPVYAGAEGPMFGPQVDAGEVHGEDGLLGLPVPEAAFPLREGKAWDVMIEESRRAAGKLEIIVTGPMTNLGIALSKDPELAGRISQVTAMGGASDFGNTTPAAEFNILADPEAAELVLRSGVPVTLCGLDVTHQAYLTEEDIRELESLGTPQARFAAAVIWSGVDIHRQYGVPGSPMHDPCALMYALEPELFSSVRCWAGVECQGRLTRGRTVIDAYSDAKREANCRWVTAVEREAFVSSVIRRLASYGKDGQGEV